MTRKGLSQLAAPAVLIAAIALGGKSLQAAYAVGLAHRFGAGAETDAFILAKSVPIGVYLVADNLLYNAVVPVYRERLDSGAPKGMLRSLALLTVAIALVLGTLFILFAPAVLSLLAPGAEDATRALAIRLGRVAGLTIFLALPASLLKAVNVSHGRYLLAALDAFVLYAVLFSMLVLAPAETGLMPLAAALPGTFAVLLAVQLLALPRTGSGGEAAGTGLLKELAPLMGPLLLFNLLHQMNTLAMNAFVSRAGAGSITCLNYSYTIAQTPVSIIDLVLLSAVFPYAAALRATGDNEGLYRAFRQMLRLVLMALLPLAGWLLASRGAVVQLVLEHGAFAPAAAAGTVACLMGHSLAIVPWAIEGLGSRFLFAQKRHGQYTAIVALRVLLTMALSALFVHCLGVLGVSLAFAFSFSAGAWLAVRAVDRNLALSPRPRVGWAPWCAFAAAYGTAILFAGSAGGGTIAMAVHLTGSLFASLTAAAVVYGLAQNLRR